MSKSCFNNAFPAGGAAAGGGGATDLSLTLTSTTVRVNSSTGNDATIAAADGTNAGVMTSAMQAKLDGIETSADVTDAANVGSSIHGVAAKTTPVNNDTIPLIDSEDSNTLKKTTWTKIKDTLKAYFDGFYATTAQANATHTGDATGATALTLATVNSNVGSFTNANVTVNAKGLVTAISNGSSGGTIATPLVYYVETTGNDGTGAVGNPALPYATGTAAYNAGVTAGVGFVIKFGVGGHTINITSDITDIYFKQAIGVGSGLTALTISGSPADAETGQAGYNVTLNIELLNLTINCPGGAATGVTTESGGNGGLQTITGSNCFVAATVTGGNSSGGNGGDGGSLRFSGQLKIINADTGGGASTGMGVSGAAGSLEMDGCDLRGCSYSTTPASSTFGRCSYTATDITPSSAMACAAY